MCRVAPNRAGRRVAALRECGPLYRGRACLSNDPLLCRGVSAAYLLQSDYDNS